MSYIPNILSILRILGTLALFVIAPWSPLFLTLYTLTGITDILDGYIARKYHLETLLGARLDSFADVIFFLTLTYFIWNSHTLNPFHIGLIIFTLLVRVSSQVIALYRFKRTNFIHTYANKIAGLLFFILPFIMILGWLPLMSFFIFDFAIYASIEELILNLISPHPDPTIHSLYKHRKEHPPK